jgi:hypothetical protein
MCNQVRGFYRGVRKFIAKIQMTFPNCTDINLCLHSYLFPSQTELKPFGHHNTYVRLKVTEHFVRRLSYRYFKAWVGRLDQTQCVQPPCSRPRISLKSIDGNGVKNCRRT